MCLRIPQLTQLPRLSQKKRHSKVGWPHQGPAAVGYVAQGPMLQGPVLWVKGLALGGCPGRMSPACLCPLPPHHLSTEAFPEEQEATPKRALFWWPARACSRWATGLCVHTCSKAQQVLVSPANPRGGQELMGEPSVIPQKVPGSLPTHPSGEGTRERAVAEAAGGETAPRGS